MHYKSGLGMQAFGITVAGWWLWQTFLAGAYAPGVWPYAVRGGFFTLFGRDAAWWVALVVVLGLLVILELGYRAAKRNLIVSGLWKWEGGGRRSKSWLKRPSWWKKRRQRRLSSAAGGRSADIPMWDGARDDEEQEQVSLEDLDVELWQSLEKDPVVRKTLHEMSKLVPDEENTTTEGEVPERDRDRDREPDDGGVGADSSTAAPARRSIGRWWC